MPQGDDSNAKDSSKVFGIKKSLLVSAALIGSALYVVTQMKPSSDPRYRPK